MKGVFLDSATLGPDIDISELKSLPVDWQFFSFTSNEEVLERSLGADIIITNKVVIDAELIGKLPTLKLICVAATGMNNIDMVAADKNNITVKNVTNYAGNSVAQVVFASVMQLLTNTLNYNAIVAEGKWSQSRSFCLFDFPITELTGKTLGLVGYGTLAKTVENIARAFDMEILISEHKGLDKVREGRTAFNDVIAKSDIISLHCPLTTETENLIAVTEFELMKSSAIIVNTARGGIVNEADLMAALTNNVIGGAIVDVIRQEPPDINYPLVNFTHPNLIITPHIAWASKEARQRLTNQLAQNVQQFIVEPF
ncbi:D-2-hydroxyacid dehydrogenase [Psychrosphaera sp. 1_MG-2023]|uniref:D-2-hydroxyacid dehydrogenase n=1 Tax=Psychrosphaera sp. 1_MG-2023 TaxID=3062643 RepID=UPI0026E19946|nr:D-2-hydroxyacid dehydrogenase [Psychrosphaera sp. 1_MG-2023]MDO6718161.1 D-2-hydroxyacid dehydrogenase [Psychrosphaera sp. 1_MG-2023]